eukprot:362159-Chlamydomonas_euryale.AAC.3
MQHNPYELRQQCIWRPPSGLFRAGQFASSFLCPPLRSKPQTFVNCLKVPLLFQTTCWPRLLPPHPAGRCHLRREIGNLPMMRLLLMRLLAGRSTASTPSDPLDLLDSDI